MESIIAKKILYSRTINVGLRFIYVDIDLSKEYKDKILSDVHTFWDNIDNRRLLLKRRHLIVRTIVNAKKWCLYNFSDAAAGTVTRATCSLQGLSISSETFFVPQIVSKFYFNSSMLNFKAKEHDEGIDEEYVIQRNNEDIDGFDKMCEEIYKYSNGCDNIFDFIIVENEENPEKPFQIIALNGILPVELKKYI